MIKLEGRVLLFDTVNIGGTIFPKTCKIDIPEKIPLLWEFDFVKNAIGFAEVIKDDEGLIAKAEIFDNEVVGSDIEDVLGGKIGVGGFYNKVKKHQGENSIVINEATLRGISLTLAPVHDEYYLEIVKED